jgi:hypothetical protein
MSEQWRAYGAGVNSSAMIGLILLSIDGHAWKTSPASMWACTGLSLVALAVFTRWAGQRVRPTWTIAVGVCTFSLVVLFAFVVPLQSMAVSTVARVGLLAHVGLMIAGSASPLGKRVPEPARTDASA